MIIAIAIATAFYATFLPSRDATRANGLSAANEDAAAGSSELAALTFSVTTQNRQQVPVPAASKQTTTTNNPLGTQPSESAGLAAPAQDQGATTRALTATTPQPALANSGAATPTATATPTPRPGADCDAFQNKLYCVYTVIEGDTLSTIASKFNILGNLDVTAAELLAMSNKPDVIDEDELSIGQKLRIPTESGVVHTVLSAQTLSDIATQYDVASEAITAVSGNGISDANTLRIGQEVLVPNPKQFFAVVAAAPTPPPSTAAAPSSAGGGTTAAAPARRSGPVSGAGFIWPVGGNISSYFTASHPLGIDIDLFSTPNAPVGAVAAGTVTFAGGNPCCSYGYYVIVDHGGGLQTLYAHFSQVRVSVGQKVGQGDILGNGGRTGYATGNHLHFEVHQNGSIVNPLNYLP